MILLSKQEWKNRRFITSLLSCSVNKNGKYEASNTAFKKEKRNTHQSLLTGILSKSPINLRWYYTYSTTPTPLNTPNTILYRHVSYSRYYWSEWLIVVLISHTSHKICDLKLEELTTVVVAVRANKITTHHTHKTKQNK